MADETEDKDSKTQEPSARKLAQAREEGQVAKSPEVASLAALAAASLVILLNGGSISRTVGDQLIPFLAHPDEIDVSGGGALNVFRAAIMAAAPAALVLLAALVAGVVGNVAQTGFLFTPKRLAPDITKLNPIAGLGRMFGPDGMVNFLKTLAKFIVMCTVIGFQLWPKLTLFKGLAGLDLAAVLPFTCDILRALLIASLVMLAVSAALDWFIQRQRFMAKMRQSRQEQKQEHKDTEGDPHIKGKLKQIRQQKARQRNLQNVPKATMVITNPTHFAVALRYIQGETPAPICVAKGADELAFRIREMATTLSIPIVEDPPLARALYAAVEIDDTIPKEHYAAVAKIVGFVLGASKRRRARPLGQVGRPSAGRNPAGRPPAGRGPAGRSSGRPTIRPEGL
jgi:flagellar biosynthetic protein FlhB